MNKPLKRAEMQRMRLLRIHWRSLLEQFMKAKDNEGKTNEGDDEAQDEDENDSKFNEDERYIIDDE